MSTVLITGASSGIWLEFAHIFAREWYDLVLIARTTESLLDLQQKLVSANVTIISRDLSLPNSSQEIYDELKMKDIAIDILINNAGFGDYGYFHEGNITKYSQMIDLNVRSLTELTYLFGKDMVERRHGRILNVASTAAFQPGPLMSVYYATKHYVLAFSEGIAEEWSDFGVTVTALCPGPTESGFQKTARAGANKIFSKKLPSSREVAEFGYKGLMARKRVIIHGFMNRIMAISVRFTPRNLIVKIVRSMQEKR